MSGYSKIKSKKSPDFSDLPSPPKQSPNHVSENNPKTQNPKQNKPKNDSKKSCKLVPESDDESEKREDFGVILSRACSVSSGSRRYKYENNGKLSAARRAFSLSRSSSVSERYSRIRHQGVSVASPYDHDEENINIDNGDFLSKKKKSRKGKIIKACKSLFKF